MAQPTIKTSFASGEWAPKLRSRVDIQKYHSGAALLRNFYVDYSGGGASTRQGTRFINQAFKSTSKVRLIGFQPSTTVGYILEFGDGYIRFYYNGSAVLESSFAITNITGNSITAAGNNFVSGDWVFIGGAYYIVVASGSPFTVSDLFGNTSVTPSGSTVARVYTLTSPYAATDLFPDPTTGNPGIKYVQDVTSMIICHPSYAPQILTVNSSNNWTISGITFGATVSTPTGLNLTSTDTGGTTWYYAYLVTAVDKNGQESTPPTPATFAGTNYIGDAGHVLSNTLSWSAVSGAVSYNVYKASPSYKSAVPSGAEYGFISNVSGVSFIDSYPGIAPDFSQTPPVGQNPFQGAGVASYTVTASGAYTTVPGVTIGSPPAGGAQATAVASLGITSIVIAVQGGSYAVGHVYNLTRSGVVYATITPLTVSGGGGILTASIVWAGSITSGSTPSNNLSVSGGDGTGRIQATWGVTAVIGILAGAGYTSAPSVTFSAGAATATSTLGAVTAGNPGVPGFIQQRLTLAGQAQAPQAFNMSQPGSFFNYNTSFPSEADDGISANIISEELNDIRNLISVPSGLLAFTGGPSWLLNGGGGISTLNPITPSNITANPQAFNGANDIKPIKINFDILYSTNKGSYVRDLSYNIYANIFTGSDISVLANHLFFNYYQTDWAWAEEPLKTLWAVRNDGTLLSLGYVKEQELIGWAHHDTNGQFRSVCSVIETVNGNTVDAVYVVVERVINGVDVQYVERMADRFFTYGYEDSWSVDCALQTAAFSSPSGALAITGDGSTVGNSVTLTDTTDAPFTNAMATNNYIVRAGGGIYKITAFTSSSQVTATVQRVPTQLNPYTNTPFTVRGGFTIWQPVTTVSGLTQLIGQSVTGVADGVVVPATTVSASGTVTLSSPASKVTLGLAFTPQMQTLPLDLGEPTVQGKRKKIVALTLRVADTLGLQAGTTFANVVTMKDFQLNAIPTTSVGIASVTDLFSGDGRTIIDQAFQEAGSYCVQQNLPYPATILGVFPEVTVGDTK